MPVDGWIQAPDAEIALGGAAAVCWEEQPAIDKPTQIDSRPAEIALGRTL